MLSVFRNKSYRILFLSSSVEFSCILGSSLVHAFRYINPKASERFWEINLVTLSERSYPRDRHLVTVSERSYPRDRLLVTVSERS